MDSLFIVANHKSNKTYNEAKSWLETFGTIDKNLLEEKKVILCPSFTLLEVFKSFLSQNLTSVSLGSQSVSSFEGGSYTGEVNAKQVKDFADYVIIGHSEERKLFNESDEVLTQKVNLSIKYGLTPIFCVQDKDTYIPNGVSIVAYEPVFAIGTDNPDTPENADQVASEIKTQGSFKVLYGGSVNLANIKNFTSQSNIDGVLVGGASLEAEEFIKIIQNA